MQLVRHLKRGGAAARSVAILGGRGIHCIGALAITIGINPIPALSVAAAVGSGAARQLVAIGRGENYLNTSTLHRVTAISYMGGDDGILAVRIAFLVGAHSDAQSALTTTAARAAGDAGYMGRVFICPRSLTGRLTYMSSHR